MIVKTDHRRMGFEIMMGELGIGQNDIECSTCLDHVPGSRHAFRYDNLEACHHQQWVEQIALKLARLNDQCAPLWFSLRRQPPQLPHPRRRPRATPRSTPIPTRSPPRRPSRRRNRRPSLYGCVQKDHMSGSG